MKNRIGIFFILLAAILGALPLCAQESCYAQYLREHNMRVLTAEDADDSYDELKKAVLAWQLYGSEASLPFAPKEEPAAPQLQDTTCAIVHLALVDSTWYMWMTVDPLADKYPNVTPYLYCNGNPIMLVDPDGRKIAGISPDDVDCFIEDVSTILSDTKFQGFCALLQRDKRSVQKIDMNAFEVWRKSADLSEDEKTYIDLLVSTINSNKIIRIEYIANNNASVSPLGNVFICNALPFLKTSDGLIAQTGGALTVSTPKGAYCLMAITGNTKSKAINSMHEVLGHGVALCVGAEPLENNSQAIRVENMIRRLTKQQQFNGQGHAEPYNNVYELPNLYLK